MTAVAVRRLALTAPDAAGIASARALVEEALRLAAIEIDERVVVLRRLDLGLIEPGRPFAARRLGDQIAALLRAGATGADLAVFETPHAARAALATTLLQGGDGQGWWWQSVVPESVNSARPERLARIIAAAMATAEGRAVLAAALARAGLLTAAAASNGDRPATSLSQAWPSATQAIPGALHAVPLVAALPAQVAARALALWPGVRLLGDDGAPAVIAGLFTAIAACPPLAATTSTARQTVMRLCEAMAAPPITYADDGPSAGAIATLSAPAQPIPATRPPAMLQGAMPAVVTVAGPLTDEPTARRATLLPVNSVETAPPVIARECLSPLAGVLLLVRALARLGLPARIAAMQAPGPDFGRLLLLRIAARHGLCLDDPLRHVLGDLPGTPEEPETTAWRVGLDRWLRRRGGLRLADVVRRRGWLTCGDAVVRARFPLRTADLRLRREALDIDPGFVPWLGLRIAYRFDDEAAP